MQPSVAGATLASVMHSAPTLAALSILLWGGLAAAAEPTGGAAPSAAQTTPQEVAAARRVVVVVAPGQLETLSLLRAELRELGLEIIELPTADGQAAAPVAAGAPPAPDFRIVLLPSHVEVWMFDRATGKTILREVFAESDGTPLDTRTAALHAVELLRWQLQGRQPRTRPRSERAESRAPRAANARPPEPQQAWLFSLVPQLSYSPGGTASGVGAQLDVTSRWSRLAARMFASSALLPNELASSEGSAQVTSRAIGFQAVAMLTERPSDSGIDASIGLGVALFSSALRGSAAGGYRAHDDRLLTAAPILDLRAGYVFSRSLALVIYTSALTPLRSSRLRFADREAGHYGELVLNIGAGPEITVF